MCQKLPYKSQDCSWRTGPITVGDTAYMEGILVFTATFLRKSNARFGYFETLKGVLLK